MTLISFCISISSCKIKQFTISLRSLTAEKFDKRLIDLYVFIDTFDQKPILSLLQGLSNKFHGITVYTITQKTNSVALGATRKNFLATQTKSPFILFTDPEMFYMGNTISTLLPYVNKRHEKSWVCGPVYGTEEIVNKSGEIVDDHLNKKINIDKMLFIAENSNLNHPSSEFNKYYHLFDHRKFPNTTYCTLFNRHFFLRLKGFNQKMLVRGFEELDLYKRFVQRGGATVYDERFVTCHLPHVRSLDPETQMAWNLYNQNVGFDESQEVGLITDAKFISQTIK